MALIRQALSGLRNIGKATRTMSLMAYQQTVIKSPKYHDRVQLKLNGTNLNTFRKITASASTSAGSETEELSRGFINRDRIILFGLGAAFVVYLCYDAKKRNERIQFRIKARQIHDSVTKAQSAVSEQHYEEASVLYREAMELAKSETDESYGKTFTLEILDQLANLAYEIQHWEEAEDLFKETLQRMLKSGMEKDSDVVIETSLKLAKVYSHLGNNELATEGFQFCMETLDKKIQYMTDIPDDTLALFGMTLTEYGTHFKAIGRLDESERAFSRALNIAKQVLGPTHEQTSVITNDLATVYDEKGRYNKAERLVQKAITIAKTTAPENLPAYTYNLGAILMHKGEFTKSKKALRQALRLAEENEDEEALELIKSSMLKLDVDT
eukprot:gene3670-4187_t